MRKSISARMNSKYQNSSRLSIVFVTLALLFVLNQAHNGQIAKETKARDNSYYSWRAITSNSAFFSGVKDRDIFISNSQNDAYETNAGSFYYYSGIRLVYLFRTVSIWPEIEKCALDSDCVLDRARERVITILPTLNRVGPDPVNDRELVESDWVKENMKPGILSQSRVWFFDIFPMTPNTVIAYLAPNIEENLTASVDVKEIRVATLSRGAKLEFRPSIGGICLAELPNAPEIGADKFGVQTKLWKIPQVDGQLIQKYIDFRALNMGTC